MWLIFLSWAYKALTSPSPREMFSPLFPVFVALKEERGGRKANRAPSFFFLFLFFCFLSFCLCQGLKMKHFFFHLCLCCPSHMPSACIGEPASKAEKESCSSAKLMCRFLFFLHPKRGKLHCWHWSMGQKSAVRERDSLAGYY